MGDTVSVRVPEEDLGALEELSHETRLSRAELLRDVLARGIREKRLELAIERFRTRDATLARAAELAHLPVSVFLDRLRESGILLHYGPEDAASEFEALP